MTEQQNDLKTANLCPQEKSEDLFVSVMHKQKEIQALLGNLPRLERPEFLREQALALIVEVVEALGETSWKSWKKNSSADKEKYRQELADVQLFLCNLLLIGDIDPVVFMQECLHKQSINIKRQQENY